MPYAHQKRNSQCLIGIELVNLPLGPLIRSIVFDPKANLVATPSSRLKLVQLALTGLEVEVREACRLIRRTIIFPNLVILLKKNFLDDWYFHEDGDYWTAGVIRVTSYKHPATWKSTVNELIPERTDTHSWSMRIGFVSVIRHCQFSGDRHKPVWHILLRETFQSPQLSLDPAVALHVKTMSFLCVGPDIRKWNNPRATTRDELFRKEPMRAMNPMSNESSDGAQGTILKASNLFNILLLCEPRRSRLYLRKVQKEQYDRTTINNANSTSTSVHQPTRGLLIFRSCLLIGMSSQFVSNFGVFEAVVVLMFTYPVNIQLQIFHNGRN